MELPPIPFEIPNIVEMLPIQIPTLIHPAVVHFMVAIPVIVLFLEIINIIMRKKAIGGTNFLLLFVMIVISLGAYLTGLTDGKEAGILGDVAKEELMEHKLMGTWIMLASVVVLFFKFISAVTKNGVLKLFYIIVLAGFVAGVLTQGKEGGELVYEYGINVQSDRVFDLEEKVEECNKKEIPVAVVIPVPDDVEEEEVVVVTPKEETTSTPTKDDTTSEVKKEEDKVESVKVDETTITTVATPEN